MRFAILFLGLLTACSGATPPANSGGGAAEATPKAAAATPEERLADAHKALDAAEYERAEKAFAALTDEACCAAAAVLGRSEVWLATGRYSEAAEAARAVTEQAIVERGGYVAASGLRALGRLDDAEALVRERLDAASAPKPRSLRILLGEILIETGRRGDAEPVLMSLIEEYNDDVITDDDGENLFWVARAANLLRSPADANDAYNLTEQALGHDARVLLARAELYLDKYDPGHAEEVLSEVLEVAPEHPRALALMAQVRLDQALDFADAKELAKRALQVNPKLARAHFLLAGLALRDMLLSEAEQHVKRGLETNPRDLELLSMLGAKEFLSDDERAFAEAERRVLDLNPGYSRFYQIVGEYAEWEHRYGKIIELMKKATRIDPEDAKAYAQLGLNTIRHGDDDGGVRALRRAFSMDPYNVRVLNTLNLYEKVIPEHYTSVTGPRFNFRYPKQEHGVLSRYVPDLMNAAFDRMVESYAFTPERPIGVEMYFDREHFAVRTSGLPRTAIQGVCFGKTLASMSPRNEQFNMGMTLWHELAHVFHIQLSKSHVPRWFTEGLAEYETLVERPEWKRERDAELFRAVRAGRLPKIGAMNEAFTHAEDMLDVTVAYYASTQIVAMMAEDFGRPKLRSMLELWGQGLRTEQVLQTALGIGSAELDQRFEGFLKKRLARYEGQFWPLARVGNVDTLRARVKQNDGDVDAQLRLALFALEQGEVVAANAAIEKARAADEKNPHVRWLQARLSFAKDEDEEGLALLEKLVKSGHDGYEVQVLLAKAADPKTEAKRFRNALERAHELDPQRSDPLFGLLQIAAQQKDTASELKWLRQLSTLTEHDGAVYRRLIELLSASGEHEAAIRTGEAAVYVDMQGLETHLVYAKALHAAGHVRDAEKEFDSSLLCPAPAKTRARAHAAYAGFLDSIGQRRRAKAQTEEALKLDPEASQ